MLILREKTILVDNQPVKFYSLDDGRTWFSKPHDMVLFERRKAEAKTSARRLVRQYGGMTCASSVDFWGR